jgi:plasmid stabilization system protein ParE
VSAAVEFTINIHRRAESDIAAVVRSSRGDANRWVGRLMKVIGTLSKLPERCPFAAEADDLGIELRELLFGKRRGTYRILFRIEGTSVIVLRIRPAAQDTLSPEDVP